MSRWGWARHNAQEGKIQKLRNRTTENTSYSMKTTETVSVFVNHSYSPGHHEHFSCSIYLINKRLRGCEKTARVEFCLAGVSSQGMRWMLIFDGYSTRRWKWEDGVQTRQTPFNLHRSEEWTKITRWERQRTLHSRPNLKEEMANHASRARHPLCLKVAESPISSGVAAFFFVSFSKLSLRGIFKFSVVL